MVEDGVDPGAEYVVNAFRNRLNIRYLPVNAALGRCMVGNLGLEAAQTDYVCFLDDDDYFFAEHLEVMACLIEEQPGCGLFVTGSVEARCKTDPENAEKFHYLSKRNSSGKLHLVDFFQGIRSRFRQLCSGANCSSNMVGLTNPWMHWKIGISG